MTRKTLNIEKAVDLLGCSRSFIYRLAREGRIEHLKHGDRKGIRFYEDSCLAYLKSRDWLQI